MAERALIGLLLAVCLATGARAQELPQDEIQLNLSGYFDNFDVTVIYPNVSLTKRVGEKTSLTGRYLVDMVSAASIRNASSTGTGGGGDDDDERERGQRVDAVSAASSRGGGLGGQVISGPDDIRHELSGGITQIVAGRLVSMNGIYSHENDYASATIAGSITQYLARKNTTLQLGIVRSWDRSFPTGENWTRTKDVFTVSGSLSQIISRRLIMQGLYSYSDNSGYLADPYKKVTIGGTEYESASPDSRIRQAAALRGIYRLNAASTIQLGYRFYWDTWNVQSHTVSVNYNRHMAPAVDLGVGVRSYLQGAADFYEPSYSILQNFMTVDSKLDQAVSTEFQFDLTLLGGKGLEGWALLEDDRAQINLSLNIYQRQTANPDSYSNRRGLVAAYFNVGLRYKLE
ncbi:MAG: DUF3570 domain-containing protein [Rhodothermales bacterium]